MVDVGLLFGKIEPNLNKLLHRKEALFRRVDFLLEIDYLLFSGEEPRRSDQFGCVTVLIPI
jgi:hypothetical protein